MKNFIVGVLLVLAVLFLLKACDRHKNDRDPKNPNVLSGFETIKIWGISPEKGFDIELSTKHVTQGSHSLKVKYPKWNLPSINTKRLNQSWGNYEALAVDIYNPEKEDLNFSVRIDDINGAIYSAPHPLAPGANTIRITRGELEARIDPTNIAFVVLFLNEPTQRYTLYFDNLRLERSELIDDLADANPDFNNTSPKRNEESLLDKILPDSKPLEMRHAVPYVAPQQPTAGEIKVALSKFKKVEDGKPFISSGIPFAPGQLKSIDDFAIFDLNGQEVPIAAKLLVRWPDESIRSVLVQFEYPIAELFEYVKLKWGVKRTTKDLKIVEPNWRFPEGIIVMPADWLCKSEVIGEQLPANYREYDKQAAQYFLTVTNQPKTGSIREDKYYSSPHVYYGLYVRTGEIRYFIEARKELVDYRENDLILEGEERGRAKVGGEPRYVFMDAMLDDYLLTGDPRTLEVMGYMKDYLKGYVPPSKGFFPKGAKHFWTERLLAYPFMGAVYYYEATGDKAYLDLAKDYMKNLYKTQLQYPTRGGFIHNLHSHDPEEGARPDEYGGSPFMTGLLLEAIIEYHRLTGDEIAADSIFRAVDWLINEGLSSDGDTFKYMTADIFLNAGGQPDLNMLVVHAFGYAYRLSGYKEDKYLSTGEKLFSRGIRDAYLERRKHFAQNYRSSGHFLAYIEAGLEQKRIDAQKARTNPETMKVPVAESLEADVLHSEPFEFSYGRFQVGSLTDVQIDQQNVYRNGNSLRVSANANKSDLSAGLSMESWDLEQFPSVSFSYKADPGVPIGMAVQTEFGDWMCIGGSNPATCSYPQATPKFILVDDGQWHEVTVPLVEGVRSVLGGVKKLRSFRFYTEHNAIDGQTFWIDDFKIKK